MGKNKGQISTVVMTIFTVGLIAIICIMVVYGLLKTQTQKTTVTNDFFVATNITCVGVTVNCIDSLTSVSNASQEIGLGNFSLCASQSKGTRNYDGLYLEGDTETVNSINTKGLNATYVGRDCNYISGMTGTMVNYLPMLMAVVLLVFVGGYVYMS